jgi:hypothetical protein
MTDAPNVVHLNNRRARDDNEKARAGELPEDPMEDAVRIWTPKPTILVSADEQAMADAAIKALAGGADVYQRAGTLVDVTRDVRPPSFLERPAGSPSIRVLPAARLRELIAASATIEKVDRRSGATVRAHVPQWLVGAVGARGEWPGIRPLAGVTEYPVMRPDGTVLERPGYDAATGLVLEPTATFPRVPASPSREHAIAAARELLEFVADFPFASDAHRSAWLTIPLTLVARPAIPDCTPLVLIDANTPGAGKTLLAEVGVAMVTGRPLPRMTQAAADEETRKRITSLAIAGESVTLVDNVAGALGGPSLDAALTSTEWTDRALGENRQIKVPLRMVWIATGNNATLAGDLLRRTLHVRLEARTERPEERSGFRYSLPGDVFKHRPRLAVAALTIVRAYLAAGCPDVGLRPWGSFEAWSRIVRGAIVWADLPDPADTRLGLADGADTAGVAMHALLDALEPHAATPKQITAAELQKTLADDPCLEAALSELIDAKLTPRTIGKLLQRMKGRVFNSRAIMQATAKGRSGVRWTVQSVTTAGGGA